MPTGCNRWFLLQILLLAQHVSGTIMPIIRSSRVLYKRAAARKPDTQPSAPHHTDNLKTKAPNTTGNNHLYNTLELLMMGIVVPETCWASNKICNKNHLLHLVGILFPHINDDAWSKSHQTYIQLFELEVFHPLLLYSVSWEPYTPPRKSWVTINFQWLYVRKITISLTILT